MKKVFDSSYCDWRDRLQLAADSLKAQTRANAHLLLFVRRTPSQRAHGNLGGAPKSALRMRIYLSAQWQN